MQLIRNLVFGTAVALFSGLASAHYAIDIFGRGANLTTGQWTRFESIENTAGNPYRAALKVRTSGVALAPGEGLVFTSDRDRDGERLQANCLYTMAGRMPKASLWSLAVSGRDAETATVYPERRFVVSRSVIWETDGSLSVAIARTIQPGNWLATPQSGEFTISLRLYDTPLALNTTDADAQTLPSIVKGPCA